MHDPPTPNPTRWDPEAINFHTRNIYNLYSDCSAEFYVFQVDWHQVGVTACLRWWDWWSEDLCGVMPFIEGVHMQLE